MIGLIMKGLGVDKLVALLIVASIMASLAGGAYWYVDHQAYNRAAVEFQGRIDALTLASANAAIAEADRQSAANDKAKQREAARIVADATDADQLQSRTEEL